VAQRLPWRRLLGTSYVVALAWAMSLALVDGWTRGFTAKLTTNDEYLAEVPGVTDIHQMLQTFTTRILDYQPGRWTTHVAAHPPGAFGVYLGLDRVGDAVHVHRAVSVAVAAPGGAQVAGMNCAGPRAPVDDTRGGGTGPEAVGTWTSGQWPRCGGC